MDIHPAILYHREARKVMTLREVRMAAGLTQGELARLGCISRSAVSHVEGGRYAPSARFAGRVCRALSARLGQRIATWELFPGRFIDVDGGAGSPAPMAQG
jgi:DNA-binding XRE family transcriptional regulator